MNMALKPIANAMTQKSPSTLLIHPSREVPPGFRSLVPGTERASTVLFENIGK